MAEVTWIRCEDRMPSPMPYDEVGPDDIASVLVWVAQDNEVFGVAYWDGWTHNWFAPFQPDSDAIPQITHWAKADLPEPPVRKECVGAVRA